MLQPSQNHIIRKQILDVEVGELSQSWEWQQRLSRFANGPLAERLGQLFDTVSSPMVTHRIDRLELTVHVGGGDNWERQLMEQISHKLEEELPKHLQKETTSATSAQIFTSQNLLTAFSHFLKSGQLPWWVDAQTAANFESKLMQELDGTTVEYFRSIFEKLLHSADVRKRLVRQFSQQTLERLAILFFGKNEKELAECQELVTVVAKVTGLQIELLEEVVWEGYFSEPAAAPLRIWQAEIARQLGRNPLFLQKKLLINSTIPGLTALRQFAEQTKPFTIQLTAWAKQSPSEFEALLFKILSTGQLPTGLTQQMKSGDFFTQNPKDSSAKNAKETKQKLSPKPQLKKASSPVLKSDNNLTAGDDKPQNGAVQEITTTGVTPFDATEIFVRNAGVVILHPFLPALFGALGLAKNGKLTKPERAVHLLHYLATGKQGAMEHEFPLNKLLCGIPLEMPVRRNIRLTKKEKNEAETVLRSVIGHWSSLGQTSPDGLRGTYLCREGKLTQGHENDWLLQVEQRTFDVLLAGLPWSISTVKLPWMQGMLQVEWS